MRTGVPIVPVAIVGSEETHPVIWKSERLGSYVGLPFIPFTPTFPWLGPLGAVPLPSKWRIMFSRPHRFNRFKPSDAGKKRLVDAHANDIRDEIQDMLDEALAKRENVWV
jgi:1-acyl-sn-glycerol-3-phosphate acyltransferase